MKNEHLLDEFMKENNLTYGDCFWVKISGNIKKQYKIVKSMNVLGPVILVYSEKNNQWETTSSTAIRDIMFNALYQIIKPVWKPQEGGIYWYVSYEGDVHKRQWENSTYDINLFLLGNCFHNGIEAQANVSKVIKLLNRNKPLVDLDEVE